MRGRLCRLSYRLLLEPRAGIDRGARNGGRPDPPSLTHRTSVHSGRPVRPVAQRTACTGPCLRGTGESGRHDRGWEEGRHILAFVFCACARGLILWTRRNEGPFSGIVSVCRGVRRSEGIRRVPVSRLDWRSVKLFIGHVCSAGRKGPHSNTRMLTADAIVLGRTS